MKGTGRYWAAQTGEALCIYLGLFDGSDEFQAAATKKDPTQEETLPQDPHFQRPMNIANAALKEFSIYKNK